MKKYKLSFLIIFFLQISFVSMGQNDSLIYSNLLNVYKKESKPPINNYFIVLSNTATGAFNIENKNFANALFAFSKSNKISEKDALEKMFIKTFSKFNKEGLWIYSENIYSENKKLLESFYNSVCPCISSKVNDNMQKILSSLQQCTTTLFKDSNYIKNVKSTLGEKSLNEFYNLKQYFTIYMYQNCPIINKSFNESILYSSVYDQYNKSVSNVKRASAENALKYFINNQFDSLQIVFPNYNKYQKEFFQIKKLMKDKSLVKNSYYNSYNIERGNNVRITLQKEDYLAGTIVFTNTSSSYNSKIEKIAFSSFKPSKKDNEIIEIIEEEVISTPNK